jgi:hypothetical protein
VLLLLGLVQVIHHHVLGLVYRIRADWRVLRLWPDGAAQRRARFDPALYEALVAANAALPSDAAILLVTPGVDPFRKEYDAFSRALYHLAPLPIWWVNPAPRVESWASRWWITVPATAEAIEAIARERGARAALFFQAAVPAELAPVVSLTPDARVVYLDGRPFERSQPMGDPVAAWHPGRLAAGLVVILALGGALVAVAARRGLAVGWIEAAALAWPLGAGATSLAMFWLDALAWPRPMYRRRSLPRAWCPASRGRASRRGSCARSSPCKPHGSRSWPSGDHCRSMTAG